MLVREVDVSVLTLLALTLLSRHIPSRLSTIVLVTLAYKSSRKYYLLLIIVGALSLLVKSLGRSAINKTPSILL